MEFIYINIYRSVCSAKRRLFSFVVGSHYSTSSNNQPVFATNQSDALGDKGLLHYQPDFRLFRCVLCLLVTEDDRHVVQTQRPQGLAHAAGLGAPERLEDPSKTAATGKTQQAQQEEQDRSYGG